MTSRVLFVIDQASDMHAIRDVAKELASHAGVVCAVLGILPNVKEKMHFSKASEQVAETLMRGLEQSLRDQMSELASVLPEGSKTVQTTGRLVEETLSHAEQFKATLIVKGQSLSEHGRFGPFLSIDKRLIRNSPIPVFVARPEIGGKLDRIAVAVDRETATVDAAERRRFSLDLLSAAIEFAAPFGIKSVSVIHAWDMVGLDKIESHRSGLSPGVVKDMVAEQERDHGKWLEGLCADARRENVDSGVFLVPQLVYGPPRQSLIDALTGLQSDVLVLGTIARTGLLGLLIGNTAEDLVDRAPCSLLTMRPQGLESN